MQKLIRIRSNYRGQVTRFANFIANITAENFDENIIKARHESFVTVYGKFEEIMNEIEALEADKPDKHDEEYTTFEEEYYTAEAEYRALMSRYAQESMNASASENRNPDISVKLPTIRIPQFDGTITNYPSYRNTFNTLIGTNPQLSTIQKFIYLKSSLSGAPAKLLAPLELTPDNYQNALQLLDNRYNNIRMITQQHLRNIFDHENCKPNHVSTLRSFIDNLNNNLAALTALKEPVEEWSSILVHLILSKVDNESRELFELDFKENRMPTFSELMTFLTQRCNSFESMKPVKEKPKNFRSLTALVSDSNVKITCPLCNSNHKIYRCTQFLALAPQARFEKAKSLNLCIKCLESGHRQINCTFRDCQRCRKSHNTLLHFESTVAPSGNGMNENSTGIGSVPEGSVLHSISSSSDVLLFTAIIRLKDNCGRFHCLRGVIDPGSQVNVITQRAVDALRLKPKAGFGSVDGFGRTSTPVSKFVDLLAFANDCNFSFPFQAFVYPEITNSLPKQKFKLFDCFSNLKLADPSYNIPGDVDFLLSNAIYTKILKDGMISDLDGKLKAINTELGFLIGGLTHQVNKFSESVALSALFNEPRIEDQIEKFWTLEDIPNSQTLNANDICEQQFNETTFRDESGRFNVQLPFISNDFDFTFSRQFALNRLLLLEKRFRKRPELKRAYIDFMREYKDLGHMVSTPSNSLSDPMAYYIPHHGVLNSNSLNPKLRVVFDGSSCPVHTTSLNSLLYTGPKLQNDIVGILARFRFYKYGFVVDITKMFRMIKMQQCHQKFQRILWRENESDPLGDYELTTVTYGLRSSPYHAIRCLAQLAKDNAHRFPIPAKMIESDSFVDDIVSGFDSLEDSHLYLSQMVEILKSGGFHLHKWNSNSKDVISPFSGSTDTDIVEISNETHRVLGILWDTKNDCFSFSCVLDCSQLLTKRFILSQLAGIFDPLGWISPSIMIGKLIMQDLWKLKLSWDDEVPESIKLAWVRFVNSLKNLKSMKIVRFVGSTFEQPCQLLGFCDASMKGYGGCIYLDNGQSRILLISKSRVCPIKNSQLLESDISIARLELLGAVLLCRLMKYVVEVVPVKCMKIKLFTDSRIVLAWLAKPASNWKQFVANRVHEIQKSFSVDFWSYISSKDNPADLLSRGSYLEDSQTFSRWMYGPSMFSDERFEFDTNLELKVSSPKILCLSLKFMYKFSSYRTTIHVFAFLFRFLKNCQTSKENRIVGPLSVDELSETLIKFISILQKMHFEKSFNRLRKGKVLSGSDALWSLKPFIDDSDCLRVGGRLMHADIPYSARHPLILPKEDYFVNLLIEHEHRSNEHANVDTLVALLRQRFWIINARTTVRKVIRHCFRCFRANPVSSEQLTGQLPKDRVTLLRPFLKVGIDYCGPFSIRPNRGRGNTTVKCYVAVFICFSVKAVHLELVHDLTTESFIATFRRFIARRGKPAEMWSDNATNFVGAHNELKNLFSFVNSSEFKNQIEKFGLDESIKWHFIPPRTPTFGGLWERSIRTMKTYLHKCVGSSVLTFEEFQTVIVQVESVLNSRPLCQTTNCSDNLNVLTPGHFLVGSHLKALPSCENFGNRPLSKRYEIVQSIFQRFWENWSKDYLTSLNRIYRMKGQRKNIEIGDIGVLYMDASPPLKWPLVKVVNLYRGPDGLVRVIDVKSGGSILKRGVQHFCPFANFSCTEIGGGVC